LTTVSSKEVTIDRRPLSDSSAHSELEQFLGIPGGSKHLGQALLGVTEAAEPSRPLEQQMLQAAVMHLAPTTRLSACCSASCCWRWASQQLLCEYAAARNATEGLRGILDAELGQSVQQRLLDLQLDYEALLHKWRTSTEELSLLRKRHSSLEAEHSQLEAAHKEAVADLATAEQAREELEAEAAAREGKLREELAVANKRPGAKELDGLLEEERAHARELQEGWDKANEELVSVRLERTDLEWKVQQLRMALTDAKKKKTKKAVTSKGKPPAIGTYLRQ